MSGFANMLEKPIPSDTVLLDPFSAPGNVFWIVELEMVQIVMPLTKNFVPKRQAFLQPTID